MKVLVIQSGSGDPTWSHTVYLEQGVQSFTLDYKGTLQECQWYAAQFQIALDTHTAEAVAACKAEVSSAPAPAQTPVTPTTETSGTITVGTVAPSVDSAAPVIVTDPPAPAPTEAPDGPAAQ